MVSPERSEPRERSLEVCPPPRRLVPSGVDWIGDVPEGWKVDKLCFAVSFGKGLNITKEDLVDDGVNVISYGQIHSKKNDGVHLTDELLRHIPENLVVGKLETKLKHGDFVFADTSEDSAGVGNCVRVDRKDVVYAGYHSLVVRPNEDAMSHYLAYLFKCDSWRTQLRAKATGIKVFTISQRLFKGISILIPPLPEQRAIAARLDAVCGKIDALKAKIEQEIAALEEYRKSLITKCVTKGLHPRHLVPSGVDWIGDVPEGWKVERVKYVFDVIGSGTTPQSDNETYYDGGIPWLQSGDLHGYHIQSTSTTITNEALTDYQLKIYKAPFVAIAMYGASIANTVLVDFDTCTNQACCALASLDECDCLSYVYFAIKAGRESLLVEAAGGTQPNINRQVVRDFKFPSPPLSEQREIADYLDKKCAAIDAVVAKRRKQLDGLAEYRKSVIYSYVTGKRETEV